MEGFEDIKPKCVGGRFSKMVCIRKSCNNHAFLCTEWISFVYPTKLLLQKFQIEFNSDEKCNACQNDHLQCRVYPYQALKKDILQKKCQVKPDVIATVRALQRMFADIVKKMDQLRTEMQSQLQYYGFTKQQAQLIKSIKLGQQIKVTGNDTAKAYKSLKQASLGLPQFNEVKNFFDYKREQTDFTFEGLHQMLFLHVQPLKIDSNIVESIKDIQQFFDIPITSCDLLFRYSTSQRLIQQFYQKCNGDVRNLLVVSKNRFGKILGGYSVGGFSNQNRFRFDPTKKSFLFSVTLKQKYCARLDRSICVHGRQENGPTFSHEGNDDFVLMLDGNIQENSFNIGDMYGQQIAWQTQEEQQRLQNQRRLHITGTQQTTFPVEDWQVFQLKFLQPYSIVYNSERLEHLDEQYIEY